MEPDVKKQKHYTQMISIVINVKKLEKNFFLYNLCMQLV